MPALQLGQPAPPFTLHDLLGHRVSLADFRGRMVLMNFWSCECPWAERADRNLGLWHTIWQEQVAWVSVASNSNESEEKLRDAAAKRRLPLVLLDGNQQVADLYAAQTTPHVFIIDPNGLLRYQGGIDDTSFRQRKPSRMHAFEAVQALLAGESPPVLEPAPFGCTIVRLLKS